MDTGTAYLNRLLPGFQAMGFAQKLNAMLRAQNVAAVRAHLPALIAQLTVDTVVVTADPAPLDLLTTWNALCDELNAAELIALKDYDNCKVGAVEDFGVKWKQLCVALDRESALSGTYAQYLGEACVPFYYQ